MLAPSVPVFESAMMDQSGIRSKLQLDDERVVIAVEEIVTLVGSIFEYIGRNAQVARFPGRY